MLPFFLYLGAGAAIAFHVYALLSLAVLGAALNLPELVSLPASLGLMLSAYVSLFKLAVAARIALLASLAAWCFYAPGIAALVKAGWQPQLADFRIAAIPYIAIVLLLLATAYSAVASFATNPAPACLFPSGVRRSTRIASALFSLAALIGIVGWFGLGVPTLKRPSSRFLVPDGYVGWVRVEFGIPGAPPVPEERGRYVFRIPTDGVLRTSSPERYGWGNDEYFYDSAAGLQKLPTGVAEKRLVWGKINGEHGGADGARQYEEFFVGTGQQFKDLAGIKKPAP